MKTKPILVRERGVTVKIYSGESRKKTKSGKWRRYKLYTVAYHVGKEPRRRETFADLAAAKARAHEVAVSILHGRLPVLELTNSDSESYLRSIQLLRSIGLPLHAAIEEYVSARSKLDGESLVSVVNEYVARKRNVLQRRVGEIVDELLVAKEHDGLSPRYVYALRSDLTRFKNSFQTNIGSVTSSTIEDWLMAQGVGARTRNNLRTSIVTLFHFARARGYLAKGQPTEADDVRRAKDRGGKIGILTPKQLASLISKAPAEIKLYLALGAFTGMRTSEIVRLDFSDLNFERGHITVAAEKSKTATRRLVPILPNLAQWLSPYRSRKGKVLKHSVERRTIVFAQGQGITWPHNCLRHSYASYRLAAIADSARVALEMGNSPQKLMTNYRELADEHDAKAWFAITPKRSTKVVQFAA
ncbi:MAG TPA: tyrosine-type recombinase/integrase [Candidatus Udaeobacter sp.]|nr:tyrosine-type recombinase/integrase [Candidatus Udaeobacter sp.]